MTNETPPSNDGRDKTEPTTAVAADASVKELVSANERLRERVEELESVVSEIHGALPTGGGAGSLSPAPPDDGEATPTLLPSGGQNYKVRGELEDSNGGVGVLGHNTAGSGTTYGVWGEVDPSSGGYGLYTPNDAKASGSITSGDNLNATNYLDLDVNGGDNFTNAYFGDNGRFFYNPDGSDGALLGPSDMDVFYIASGAPIQFTEFGFGGTKQRTAGPIAKGNINSDASIANAVNVSSVAWVTDHYEITLDDDDYWFDEYATYVTGVNDAVSWRVTSNSPDVYVKAEDGAQHNFMFVTHKLISGQATTSSVSTDGQDTSETPTTESTSTDASNDPSTR